MDEIKIRFEDPIFYCAECHEKKDPSEGVMFIGDRPQNGQFEFLCCSCITKIIEEMEEAFE